MCSAGIVLTCLSLFSLKQHYSIKTSRSLLFIGPSKHAANTPAASYAQSKDNRRVLHVYHNLTSGVRSDQALSFTYSYP